MAENFDLEIEKFDHEGRGLGFYNGKIVFVDGTIPGDVVNVNIVKNKKNFAIASIKKILKYSPDRIESICPYFDKCGGCDIQNIDYNKQLIFKENKVKEILEKFGNIKPEIIKPIINLKDNNFKYRNKITFQVKKSIGMFGKKSYDLVEVDKCYLIDDEVNNVLKIIQENMDLEFIKQIVIRKSFYNNDIMVIFAGDNLKIKNLDYLKTSVSSIYIKCNEKYNLIFGKEYLEEKLGDYIFKISPDSFFQVNTKMCIELYNKIIEYGNFNGTEKVLDLYCGTGTISIYISKYIKSVLGYEINKYAVMDANENKKNNLIDNVSFICGSSELSFENITDNIDVIIVDPPRSGLNDKTIQGIVNVKPCKVIYVSCDPVTLSRDLKLLSDYYEITEVTPVDMFPNTKHVETITVLNLKN